MADHNIETQFKKAKASYDQSKAEFERKKKLYESKAIAKAEFEKATRSYELARSEYNNLASNYGSGGKQVKARSRGFLKTILVTEGQYVKVGDPLAIIAQNRKLTLQADVPQTEYAKMKDITSANFKASNSDVAHSIEDFNGKLLSYGKSVSREEPFIPVQFEIDNQGDVLPGSYIDMYIKTQTHGAALVVPVSALIESVGNYSVFVQTEGESFEKRDITTGVDDGQMVEVLSGLIEGEMVVTKGAYQVKMASMSSTVPAHGHAH
jgi:cobalt-zinc-cadmium efflux system membrane fusion protein